MPTERLEAQRKWAEARGWELMLWRYERTASAEEMEAAWRGGAAASDAAPPDLARFLAGAAELERVLRTIEYEDLLHDERLAAGERERWGIVEGAPSAARELEHDVMGLVWRLAELGYLLPAEQALAEDVLRVRDSWARGVRAPTHPPVSPEELKQVVHHVEARARVMQGLDEP